MWKNDKTIAIPSKIIPPIRRKTITISPFNPFDALVIPSGGSVEEQMRILKKALALCMCAHFKVRHNPDVHQAPTSLLTMATEGFEGGKGIRGWLVVLFARMVGTWHAFPQGLLRVATSMEMLHAYSLIHDDLPCMDNSLTRRGKPTLHCVYGEADAMMAGNLLLSEAVSLLCSRETHPNADTRIRLVSWLCDAVGQEGLMGGQHLDLAHGENRSRAKISREEINERKTVKLFQTCVLFAQADGSQANKEHQSQDDLIMMLAGHFGHLFQSMDDSFDWKDDQFPQGKQQDLLQKTHQHFDRIRACVKQLRERERALFQPVLSMMEKRWKLLL